MFNSNETVLRSSHNYTNLTTYENATKVESLNFTSTNDIKFHAQAKVLQPYEYVSFVLATGSISSNLSIIAAASACYYILKQEELNLGKYDWKMFSFMFVFPAIVLVTANFNGGMGHNGLYCGLKEGKGVLWNFLMIFIPIATIIIVESILYILILYKLHGEVKKIKKSLGNQSMASKQIVVAARNMSFFVLVIILRFLTPAIHGCWVFIAEPPRAMYEINTYATCFGGIFNGIIYLTIRREHL
ncbi:unnamed protein product [Mytilus coruscus]|uniref:G-protein coupled receptors family 1 profile domain-containing protein n=1 Tax=Mytilus coruscus TaxID=42192 RepID=A0A6J8AUC3_MYTCO|nr:unnamed protein product [Mytilus coruscus]